MVATNMKNMTMNKTILLFGCGVLIMSFAPQVVKLAYSSRSIRKAVSLVSGEELSARGSANASAKGAAGVKQKDLHLAAGTPSQLQMTNLKRRKMKVTRETVVMENKTLEKFKRFNLAVHRNISESFLEEKVAEHYRQRRNKTKAGPDNMATKLMKSLTGSDDVVKFFLGGVYEKIKSSLLDRLEEGETEEGNLAIENPLNLLKHFSNFFSGAGVTDEGVAQTLEYMNKAAESMNKGKNGYCSARFGEHPLTLQSQMKCDNCQAEVVFPALRFPIEKKESYKKTLADFHAMFVELSEPEPDKSLANYKPALAIGKEVYINFGTPGLMEKILQAVFDAHCSGEADNWWQGAKNSFKSVTQGPFKFILCELFKQFPSEGIVTIGSEIHEIVGAWDSGISAVQTRLGQLQTMTDEIRTLQASVKTAEAAKAAEENAYASARSTRNMFSAIGNALGTDEEWLKVKNKIAELDVVKTMFDQKHSDLADGYFSLISVMLQTTEIRNAIENLFANFIQWSYSCHTIEYVEFVDEEHVVEENPLPSRTVIVDPKHNRSSSLSESASFSLQAHAEASAIFQSKLRNYTSQAKHKLKEFKEKWAHMSDHVSLVEDDNQNLLEVEDESVLEIEDMFWDLERSGKRESSTYPGQQCCADCCEGCDGDACCVAAVCCVCCN